MYQKKRDALDSFSKTVTIFNKPDFGSTYGPNFLRIGLLLLLHQIFFLVYKIISLRLKRCRSGREFEWLVSHQFIFTASNEVGARLCFHRHVWFCSQGGGSASVHGGIPPPPPEADTPWEQTPQEQTLPRHRACWEIQSMRGQYASYWNAILLKFRLDFQGLQRIYLLLPLFDYTCRILYFRLQNLLSSTKLN